MSGETVSAAPDDGRLAPEPEVLAAILAAVQIHLDAERTRPVRPDSAVRFPCPHREIGKECVGSGLREALSDVDRLLGRVQAVIQALGEGLQGLSRFSGATILGDGSVSLILDLAALVIESRSAENYKTSPNGGRAEGF